MTKLNSLYTFHRILIVCAMLFGLVLMVYGATASKGQTPLYGLAALGGMLSVVLGFYLRWFIAKNKV